MSLITCCPECGTMFKVVPDQLKVSEGWVRCGHCSNIFDATANLADAVPPGAGASPAPAPTPTPTPTRAPTPWSTPAIPARAPSSQVVAPSGAGTPPSRFVPPAPAAEDSRRSGSDFREKSASVPSVSGQADEIQEGRFPATPLRRDVLEEDPGYTLEIPPASAADEEWKAGLGTADAMLPLEADAPLRPAPAEDDVSFLKDGRRKARWRRPLVRVVLFLALLLLLGALVLQWAIHERDRIAATQPALRPLLQRACELLNCRIGSPRQIESVAIDSSTFNKLRAESAYRLSFTLKNSAAIPVAMPSLELTLTDTQDQALLRKVLTPTEFGAAANVIAAASEWSGSVAIAVAANGAAQRVAGYRLLAFYP